MSTAHYSTVLHEVRRLGEEVDRLTGELLTSQARVRALTREKEALRLEVVRHQSWYGDQASRAREHATQALLFPLLHDPDDAPYPAGVDLVELAAAEIVRVRGGWDQAPDTWVVQRARGNLTRRRRRVTLADEHR